jgi:hypothetical protein
METSKCIIRLEMEKKNIQRILDLHQDFDPSSYCPRMHGNKSVHHQAGNGKKILQELDLH